MQPILFRSILTLLPFLYMLFIWLQSSKFNPSQLEYIYPTIHPIVFLTIGATLELAHLIQFGILYLLIIVAFLTYDELNSKKEKVALTIALLYGITDEIHQYFVPFRSFSSIDVLKDIIGVLVIWFLIRRKYYSSNHSRIGSFLKGITNLSRKNKPNIPL
ncbi:VanZ family protein [Cytobacillus sp. S13-E01]|uniref:VanZ family protein n=1 Tax=Cytobacillus sp. S13-E01 TaxID=3031326 RepID=UPI0023D8AC5D|nr:VanZ family protein [Cytobacillus sp. S13-E01]MDF0727743.1 VanZ family protein [Cytobacillus sp. S13-E01]